MKHHVEISHIKMRERNDSRHLSLDMAEVRVELNALFRVLNMNAKLPDGWKLSTTMSDSNFEKFQEFLESKWLQDIKV